MMTIMDAIDNGTFDADKLAKLFDVQDLTILHDLTLLRRWGLVDFWPAATPGTCECCKSLGPRVSHHWTDNQHFFTKQVCKSCNSKLGKLFNGKYPSWEEQVRAVRGGK